MKITNKKRFYTFITIVIILSITLFTFCFNALAETVTATATEYETVVVEEGDTLWSISENYCPENMDIRKYIYEVEQHNDCTASIEVGTILEVPIY